MLFTILGFVVALLIHFIVLSSPRYDWLDNDGPPQAIVQHLSVGLVYLQALL